MSSCLNLHTSATAAQVRPTALLAKRKATLSKRPMVVAGSDKPAPKKRKVFVARRVQHPLQARANIHPPLLVPSTDHSLAHMVFDELPDR
jgi:hypothetical protein